MSAIFGRKHCEKEKLLVTSSFSFSHYVFHSYISLVPQNAALCGNGLINPFPNKPLFSHCLYYKSFENTVRKGEIAHNEQFSPFPTAFSTPL